MTDVELKLQVALLRAELLEHGVHPIAVRGLITDEAVTARLASLEVQTLAADIVRTLPRAMLRAAEAPEDWAARRFGGENVGSGTSHMMRRTRPKSEVR
jgi:hypothetical protein